MATKEQSSISRLPILTRSNYVIWKTRMRVYLQSLDDELWEAVEDGWSCPVKLEGNKEVPKSRKEWNAQERAAAKANYRALHSIISCVDDDQLRLISTCQNAKEAWKSLEHIHEGTSYGKRMKLEMIDAKFDNLKMEEDEDINTFHRRLNGFINEAFMSGKTYSNTELVKKVLRSLPDGFSLKVGAVKEFQDLNTLNLEELMISLQAYEWIFLKDGGNTGKALETIQEQSVPVEINESDLDEFVMVAKGFTKMLRNKFKENRKRGICMECGGKGHLLAECPSAKRKIKDLRGRKA